MKLSILENAFHSFYYAMWLSNHADVGDQGEKKEYDDGYVIKKHEYGGQSFHIDVYQKPPNNYLSVISLQQEIRSLELFLKAIIQEKINPDSIYKSNGDTIGFYTAINIVNNWLKKIKILKDELENIKYLRNCIEHADFSTNKTEITEMQKELTCLIYVLVRHSLNINIVDYFQWDSWRENIDDVGEKIQSLLSGMGERTKNIESIFLNSKVTYGNCFNCSCHSVSSTSGICHICLYEMEPELVQKMIELDSLKKEKEQINKLL